MTPKEQIEQTVNAIGAIVEVLKIFNDELIDKGFSASERLTLCGVMLTNLMTPKGGGDV